MGEKGKGRTFCPQGGGALGACPFPKPTGDPMAGLTIPRREEGWREDKRRRRERAGPLGEGKGKKRGEEGELEEGRISREKGIRRNAAEPLVSSLMFPAPYICPPPPSR